jgi:hypothetical protein
MLRAQCEEVHRHVEKSKCSSAANRPESRRSISRLVRQVAIEAQCRMTMLPASKNNSGLTPLDRLAHRCPDVAIQNLSAWSANRLRPALAHAVSCSLTARVNHYDGNIWPLRPNRWEHLEAARARHVDVRQKQGWVSIALTRSGASGADSANSMMKRLERAGSDCRGFSASSAASVRSSPSHAARRSTIHRRRSIWPREHGPKS